MSIPGGRGSHRDGQRDSSFGRGVDLHTREEKYRKERKKTCTRHTTPSTNDLVRTRSLKEKPPVLLLPPHRGGGRKRKGVNNKRKRKKPEVRQTGIGYLPSGILVPNGDRNITARKHCNQTRNGKGINQSKSTRSGRIT